MLPSRYTSRMSLEDAATIAKNLGITYREISIESAFSAFLSELEPLHKTIDQHLAAEKLQAGAAEPCLMALSNCEHRLLLTTSNKSELAVGYATLYGIWREALVF